WFNQIKFWNFSFKTRAVVANHQVEATHRSNRRFEWAKALVLKTLHRLKSGLLSDNSCTFDFLFRSFSIHDDPVPISQLRWFIAEILNSYLIGKEKIFGLR